MPAVWKLPWSGSSDERLVPGALNFLKAGCQTLRTHGEKIDATT